MEWFIAIVVIAIVVILIKNGWLELAIEIVLEFLGNVVETIGGFLSNLID